MSDPLADCRAALDAATREAQQNAAAARDAQDELQQFVYAASHDLQQPLRAVTTYAQLLLREFPGETQARELLNVIIENAGQMTVLVRDLLNYSRLGTSPRPAEVNLNAALQSALYVLTGPLQESGGQVALGDLVVAFADERQLAIVFENLLSNAIKYRSAEAPRIRVESQQDGDLVTVSVSDNGVGVPPEFQDRIFEPFKRLQGKQIPGSGLGLSICRKIVRAQGGRIWIESDGAHGSVVKFTLPAGA